MYVGRGIAWSNTAFNAGRVALESCRRMAQDPAGYISFGDQCLIYQRSV